MQVPAEGNADSAEAQIPAINRAAGAARGRDTVILQGRVFLDGYSPPPVSSLRLTLDSL